METREKASHGHQTHHEQFHLGTLPSCISNAPEGREPSCQWEHCTAVGNVVLMGRIKTVGVPLFFVEVMTFVYIYSVTLCSKGIPGDRGAY